MGSPKPTLRINGMNIHAIFLKFRRMGERHSKIVKKTIASRLHVLNIRFPPILLIQACRSARRVNRREAIAAIFEAKTQRSTSCQLMPRYPIPMPKLSPRPIKPFKNAATMGCVLAHSWIWLNLCVAWRFVRGFVGCVKMGLK